MKVIIDGVEKPWSTEGGASLERVMQEVGESLIVESRRIITSVRIGDVKPGLDMSLMPAQVAADDIESIEFATQDIGEALEEEISRAEEMLRDCQSLVPEIVNHIVSDEIEPAMTKVKTCIEGLIGFTGLLRQLNAVGVKLEDISCGEMNLTEYIDRLNGVLTELTDAMENGDFTLINDYLEYELGPAIVVLSSTFGALRAALESVF